jgi:hypothetical protein
MIIFSLCTAASASPVAYDLTSPRAMQWVARDLSSAFSSGVTYEEPRVDGNGVDSAAARESIPPSLRVSYSGEHDTAIAALDALFETNPDVAAIFAVVDEGEWVHIRPRGGSILDYPVTITVPSECPDVVSPLAPPPACEPATVLVSLLDQVAKQAGVPVRLAMLQGMERVSPPESRVFEAVPARTVLEWWLAGTTPHATWSLTYSSVPVPSYGLDVLGRPVP